jgi:hypothetical protein
MKRLTILAVLANLLMLSHASQLHAQEECSVADLTGAYSFEVSGTSSGLPFAASGVCIYDGNGSVDGVIQASVGGTIYPPAALTATYDVSLMAAGGGKTACVITKTIVVPAYGNLKVSFFGTAGDHFKETRWIATTPGYTVTVTARKQ